MKSHAKHPHARHHAHAQRPHAFRDLEASELYCPKCQASRPVRERLLLVLPEGELHEYRCSACASSLGTRTVRSHPQSPVKITL
jgi:hypothetical protein